MLHKNRWEYFTYPTKDGLCEKVYFLKNPPLPLTFRWPSPVRPPLLRKAEGTASRRLFLALEKFLCYAGLEAIKWR